MMRRSAALIVIVALVAAALWATGVVTVKVNPPTTDSVSASPFRISLRKSNRIGASPS